MPRSEELRGNDVLEFLVKNVGRFRSKSLSNNARKFQGNSAAQCLGSSARMFQDNNAALHQLQLVVGFPNSKKNNSAGASLASNAQHPIILSVK